MGTGSAAAISAHQVMLTMLLDTYHDLDERRRQAERDAAAVLEEADRARAGDPDRGGADRPGFPLRAGSPIAGPFDTGREQTSVIDLSEPEPFDRVSPAVAGSPVFAAAARANGHDEHASSGYFDFLRGALEDDQPLGPSPE